MNKATLYNSAIDSIETMKKISTDPKDVKATGLAFDMVHNMLAENDLRGIIVITAMIDVRIDSIKKN